MEPLEPGFELIEWKKGRMGSFAFVRLDEVDRFCGAAANVEQKRVMRSLGDQVRSLECILPTQGMRSIISMVSISLEGFLPSILLLVVIIVTVVIVAVILVVVVVAIVGVVIVVMIIGVVVGVTIIGVVVVGGGVSFIIKLLFVIIGFLHRSNPRMKASRNFSVFGTMFGNKTASSWNLLTYGLRSFPLTVRL
ncbi:hypothetical protein Tco_0674051 [Tanacetum coccineum]